MKGLLELKNIIEFVPKDTVALFEDKEALKPKHNFVLDEMVNKLDFPGLSRLPNDFKQLSRLFMTQGMLLTSLLKEMQKEPVLNVTK